MFNEKEFQKIIEHEEMVDEREKAQKEYAQRYIRDEKSMVTYDNRTKTKEKKRILSPKPHVESKVKSMFGTATSKFNYFLPRAISPKNDSVFITREERRDINKSVQEQISQKEEEMKKQLSMQVHSKRIIFGLSLTKF